MRTGQHPRFFNYFLTAISKRPHLRSAFTAPLSILLYIVMAGMLNFLAYSDTVNSSFAMSVKV